jgi:thiamine-monophosphate kinase
MKSNSLKVSDIGEKGLINRIINKNTNFSKSSFKNYLGDDAALIDNNENFLIATSDMLIQSVHFPNQMSYFQMGFKVVTVNVSDIAAMGGVATGFLFNISIPKDLKLLYFDQILEGVLKACEYYNLPLIGGDTNESNEIILSGTALGRVEKNKQLLKSGFKEGDLIAITGKLGLAPLGFELLNLNIKEDFNHELVDLAIFKALNPIAKFKEGCILSNFASSATDITDGLSEELYEIFYSNKINSNLKNGLLIYESKLPIDKEFIILSNKINKNPLELFFNIGEDFELLFTLNKKHVKDLESLMDFYIIGEVTNSDKVEIVDLNGNIKTLLRKGYEHLK